MTPARVEITEAQIFDELRSASRDVGHARAAATDNPRARTVRELARATGMSEFAVRRALTGLYERKQLDVCTVHRFSLDGRLMAVPGYVVLNRRLAAERRKMPIAKRAATRAKRRAR